MSWRSHTFAGFTGYLIAPETSSDQPLSLRHSASVSPWADADVHYHDRSAEPYLLISGKLSLLVAGTHLTLHAGELMLVKRKAPHAVLGGEGLIEHFLVRCPEAKDRRSVGVLPNSISEPSHEDSRELVQPWGYRIPLRAERNQNCWLLGIGAARFHCQNLGLAYLSFGDQEPADAGSSDRHRPHFHKHSGEYYSVLEGSKSLSVEGETVTLSAGEMAVIPPGVTHAVVGREAPFRGFTMRTPLLEDKVTC